MAWVVYMVRCRDRSLYTGMTNRLEARLAAHNAGTGAKYTRSRRPVELVWQRRCRGQTQARKLEAAIKALTRKAKLAMLG